MHAFRFRAGLLCVRQTTVLRASTVRVRGHTMGWQGRLGLHLHLPTADRAVEAGDRLR